MTVPESLQSCAGPASLWDMHVGELDSDHITFLSEPQIAAEYVIHMSYITCAYIHVTFCNSVLFMNYIKSI